MAPDAFDEDDDARAALDPELRPRASTPASVWLEESRGARVRRICCHPAAQAQGRARRRARAEARGARVLRAHVSSLGPPHTLVLTGPEGSGKTTELAVLADWLRRGRREVLAGRAFRRGRAAAPDARLSCASSSRASAARPLSGRETWRARAVQSDRIARAPRRREGAAFRGGAAFADADRDPAGTPRTFWRSVRAATLGTGLRHRRRASNESGVADGRRRALCVTSGGALRLWRVVVRRGRGEAAR